VHVVRDALDEPDERFFVDLANPVNASIQDGHAVGLITDDDVPPTISISDATVVEGSGGGTTNLVFTISLSAPSTLPVAVHYKTLAGTPAGPLGAAGSPSDFSAVNNITVTFAPGQTSQTIAVSVARDALDEPDERFFVDLFNPQNGALIPDSGSPLDLRGVGIIVDDDDAPALSINDVTVNEGTATNGSVTTMTFTVSLSSSAGSMIFVDYSTADAPSEGNIGSAISNIVDQDYFPVGLSTLAFSPGQVSQTISVQVVRDRRDEIDERLFVNLSNPQNATIAHGQGVGRINDDDAPPTISISDATVVEGTGSGLQLIHFFASLSAPSGKQVSVVVVTQNGTAGGGLAAAVAPDDYAPATIVLTFDPGMTGLGFDLGVVRDALDEPDERFFATLANPLNASIQDGQGVGRINDDDAPPAPVVFTNAAPVLLSNVGPAAPYPSEISVSGLTGTISKLTVTITGFIHTYPDDLDFLLVGPQGQNAIIWSDVGGQSDFTGLTLTLDDQALVALPNGTLSSGTFRPMNYGAGDSWPSPAPLPIGGSALSTFNGTSPNGVWRLFIMDDEAGDSGQIVGGWTLSITQ
jgi:hypothetical protein